ncbi:hypothetical protein QAD02_015214 [Eretmocerus hayati]|uniref:Uncharacterized protein n=1 Tax=Eretmocerus hayati TaxID=131215 RepID=A0ACC2P7M1_9HYME|nr:hypothetical protein QAD02_015214 [Eretmocerus hayati]
MANYSSDSDSEKSSRRHRRKHQRRSSSVDSINSSSSHHKRQKYSKSRRRHRSRSKSRDRDRSSKSHKHSRGASRDRRKHRSHRSRSASTDRNKSRKRSTSRDKSTSRSSSSQSNTKVLNPDKLSNAPKDSFLITESRIKASVIDDINNDEFVPRQFVSSAKDKESKSKNIVIDISGDTIHVPQLGNTPDATDSIFHTSIMSDKEAKFDRWVKKLFTLRQKAINELNCTS